MAELTVPSLGLRDSFLAGMAEFSAEGRGAETDQTEMGDEMREFGPGWSHAAGFARYVDWLVAQAREDSPRRPGYVPATTLWWVEDEEYLGRIAVRHRLTAALREVGGHIGYDVRPSARCRGHATAMLRSVLPVARGLGIGAALLTCEVDNVASRKVIEGNGGVLDDQRGTKLRYWVSTG